MPRCRVASDGTSRSRRTKYAPWRTSIALSLVGSGSMRFGSSDWIDNVLGSWARSWSLSMIRHSDLKGLERGEVISVATRAEERVLCARPIEHRTLLSLFENYLSLLTFWSNHSRSEWHVMFFFLKQVVQELSLQSF